MLTGSLADTLAANEIRLAPIFPNASRGGLAPGGDDVIVVVTTDRRSVSNRYRLAFDGCFVQKLVGPDTLVVR